MLYLDTNILVYSLVNQDNGKMIASQALINQCIADSSLLLSPLILQELAFTLDKLNLPQAMIRDSFEAFKVFVAFDIDMALCDSGFQLALASNMLRSINDAIHARFAERHASRLVTFDAGFKKFIPHISIPIDVIS